MNDQHSGTLPVGLGASLRRLLWIIPVGIVGNLAYTLLATDRDALVAGLSLSPSWLVATAVIAIAPLGFNSLRVWRWARFLRPGFTYKDAIRTVLLAEVSAAVTPSVIGGGALKMAWLATRGLGPGGAITLTALGSIEDVIVVGIGLPLAALASGHAARFAGLAESVITGASPATAVLGLAAISLVAWGACRLLLRGRRGSRRRVSLRRWSRELRKDLALIRRRGLVTFLGNLALAALQWTARLSLVAALVAGLGAPMGWMHPLVLQWICFLVMTLTPTPGAVGGAEAGFLLVFGRELPAALVPLVLASWRLVGFYGLNLFSLALLMTFWRRRAG